MTTNEIYFFSGPAAYAKVFENNRDKEGYQGAYKAHDGMYTIMVGLNEKDADTLYSFNRRYEPKDASKFAGVDTKAHKGRQFFPFRRKHASFNKKGEVIAAISGPPNVIDHKGDPWDPKVMIGNGSMVTVKTTVSRDGNKTYVRLEGVRVDELVPYTGSGSAEVRQEPETGLPF